jgi:squalene synthase HpnC
MPAAAIDPATPPIRLLDRFGPGRTNADALPLADSLAYCRGLALGHYENFSVLSGLVPARLRDDFAAVYAFCRWSDDLADETGTDDAARHRSLDLLAWWRAGLHACWTHARASTEPPTHPVFIALRETFARHPALPRRPFDDLIDAFEQDQRVTAYADWTQLLDYCARSANPVGRIVLGLGGYADEPANAERVRMSDSTCTALQLVNFWQDARRDLLERGRVYLPSEETGITPNDLRAWADTPDDWRVRVRYIRALRPLVERTRALFDSGRGLPARLDPDLGPVVGLFADGGVAILRAVEAVGCATLWHRPRIGKAAKALLVARAMLRARMRFRP